MFQFHKTISTKYHLIKFPGTLRKLLNSFENAIKIYFTLSFINNKITSNITFYNTELVHTSEVLKHRRGFAHE